MRSDKILPGKLLVSNVVCAGADLSCPACVTLVTLANKLENQFRSDVDDVLIDWVLCPNQGRVRVMRASEAHKVRLQLSEYVQCILHSL